MFVALTAVLVTGFYTANVPLKLAFFARLGEEAGAALGVRPFEGRFALAAAREGVGAGKTRARRKKHAVFPKKRGQVPGSALRAARALLPRLRLEALGVSLEVGLSDAAATALAVGGARALLSAVGAATGARVEARLQPDFGAARLRGEVWGIVSLTVGHIMLAVCREIFDRIGRKAHGQTSD